MKAPRRGRPQIIRDGLAGLLPWPFYFIGIHSGHEGFGMVGAVLALILFRAFSWREVKLYEMSLATAFVLVCLGAYVLRWDWVLHWKPVAVPLSLFVGSLATILLGRPFSMKYARQFARQEWWWNPHFFRVNRIISSLWCAVFAFGAVLSFSMVATGWPGRVALAMISFLMMVVAFCFTRKFPRWYRFHRYLPEVKAGRESYMKAPEL